MSTSVVKPVVIRAGEPATFGVKTDLVAPWKYQWKRNGAYVGGSHWASYSTAPLQTADLTAKYSVVVYGQDKTEESAEVQLIPSVAPTVSIQPNDQAVMAGQSASFAVTAAGTPPFDYQWQKNGADIGGATSQIYSTTPTVMADNGAKFTATVKNSVGSVTSKPATLTVTVGQPVAAIAAKVPPPPPPAPKEKV